MTTPLSLEDFAAGRRHLDRPAQVLVMNLVVERRGPPPAGGGAR